ncbi:octopamine receptor beta-1R-like [Actinia tenebrosa]|uniref:Octopamine receptor beta-1R-like n=1 Tax=Actinia tenebrosa TaxID=6105 RepID=A0A6P8HVX0_ACTTE|nr:octopamine receptor beta-1R-like [Actinia tenebrosa]
MMDNQTNKSSFPSKDNSTSPRSLDWYWTLRWIIGVFIISGNSIIIITVMIRRRLRNNIPNQFIVSLAVADLLTGVVIIPATYHCSFHECDWSTLFTAINFLLFSSISNLCVMTLDRFLAVVFPYAYQTFMTQRKALFLMAVAWVIPFIVSVIPIAWKYKQPSEKASYEKTFMILQTLIIEITPCILMLVTHIPIYLIVRKHSRQIACQNASQVNNQSQSKAKNERSTVKVFTLVVFLFIVCYGFSIYREVCRQLELCNPPLQITLVSRLLYLSNSAMNPFVYSFLKRDIRQVMKQALTSCLRRFGETVDLRDESESSRRSRQPHPREMGQQP